MASWLTPKTDWAAEDGVLNDDFNRIEGNTEYLHEENERIASGMLHKNLTIYVRSSGDDMSGDGTSSSPFRTITKALSLMPKNLNGYIATIDIGTGTYNEDVSVDRYYGGLLKFSGNGNVTVSDFTVANGSQVIIEYIILLINGSLTVRNDGYFFSPVSVTVGGGSSGIYALNGGVCIIDGTTTVNNTSTFGVTAMNGGRVYLSRLGGSGNNIGLYATLGGMITHGSSSLSATTASMTETGGRIYSGAQTSVPNY